MTPLEARRPKLRTVVLALAGVVVVAVTLFRVPLATVFTLGLLLVCPLLMIGMHGGGHGRHASANGTHADPERAEGDRQRGVGAVTDPPRRGLGPARNTNHEHQEA